MPNSAQLAKAFQIPPDGPVFISDIVARCEGLIDLGIWSGLTRTRLHRWLNNFHTDPEKYLAACLLDSLIYRSDSQTRALIQQLTQRILPDLARARGWAKLIVPDWAIVLQNQFQDPLIRLVAVATSSDPPTKSSQVILRYLKRHFNVSEKWLLSTWSPEASSIPPNTVIIFIDDFLGTGSQFEAFYNKEQLPARFASYEQAYTPLVAWSRGALDVEKTCPKITVRSVELLDNSHRIFHGESKCFDDGFNDVQAAQTFYNALLANRGIQLLGDERRGYGGLELAYSFEHASPDNCLPLFWWKESVAWAPLFDR